MVISFYTRLRKAQIFSTFPHNMVTAKHSYTR